MMDLDDVYDLNGGSQSQNVVSVDGEVFSMNEEARGLVERAPHIQFLGVCPTTSRLPEIFID